MPIAELDAIRAEVRAPAAPRQSEVLTPEALGFLSELHRRFEARRKALLKARLTRQARHDAGELPDFRPTTCGIGASRSLGRWTARWSSTRSTAARACSWPTSKMPPRPPGPT
jgi:malate synthase